MTGIHDAHCAKAMPTHTIDVKIQIKKQRNCITCETGCYSSIVIYSLGGGHTHAYQCCPISRNQVHWPAACAQVN